MVKYIKGYVIRNCGFKTRVIVYYRIQCITCKYFFRRLSKKYLVIHDFLNISKIGDLVLVKEVRPISKKKNFVLVKIVKEC